MKLLLDVSGEKQINREILRVGGRAVDAQPAFVAIGQLFMRETRDQFASEGRHASGGWAALKPATVAAKQAGGFRTQILQRTGSLLDSLTVEHDPNMVFDPGAQQLVFGSKVPYSIFHQSGTQHMPRRRPLEFTELTRREAVKLLQRYLLTGEVTL